MPEKLNLFYEEPDPDRWLPYDRYIRKAVRRIVRGPSRPGGVMMVAFDLMRGLDKLGIPYRFNDYQHVKKNPCELIGVIGKPHLIFEKRFKNPIIFGAGVYSHPIDCPKLFEDYSNVKKMLVPGPWMEQMCKPYYKDKVISWPVGINTEVWNNDIKCNELLDFLIYDKIRWDHSTYEINLINPIIKHLQQKGLSYQIIRYGHYTHTDLKRKLSVSKAVIFLCEHETQGLAYQQILATNTPILAWNRAGYWQDPSYFPHKVKYQPVSSVPYWSERCGSKFSDFKDFPDKLLEFLDLLNSGYFFPRNYILDNLTLEKSAALYLDIYNQVEKEL
jgi:hypothetical protein